MASFPDTGSWTVRDVVARLAAEVPAASALAELDGPEWTFGELSTQVERLITEIPVGARRVGVHAGNDVHSVARICAVWQSGASAVLLGALLPDQEVARRVNEAHCDAVLGRPGIEPRLAPGQAPAEPDEALVVFTSGTTGRPKGAVLTVDALRRSVEGIATGSGLPASGRLPRIPSRSASPLFVPMAHMAGALGIIGSWHLGKPLLIVPKFDVRVALRLIDDFGVTALKLTPAMVYDLAHFPENRDLGGVRSVTVGTAPIPDVTRELFERRYGLPVLRNYGQTEFSGAIAFERSDDVAAGRRPPGTAGRVAPGVRVRIVSPDGIELGAGAAGEIVASGGGAMAGYIGADGRPQPSLSQGWLHTGDLGALDADGFLTVLGRAREMILCGGFNVSPAVVESALNGLPGVVDSLVAGEPHPRLGEVPVAVVVTDRPLPGLDDLRVALRAELAPYEIPRQIVPVAVLPRTDNGKPDRSGVHAAIAAVRDGSGDAAAATNPGVGHARSPRSGRPVYETGKAPRMAVSQPHARIEERNAILTVILDRDAKLNAISPQITELLWQAVRDLASRADLRAMVITARGRYFSAGMDLNGPGATSVATVGSQFRASYRAHHLLYDEFEAVEKPVVLAAQGPCLGGALEMACSCDFRFAAASARFQLPEVGLGVIAGSGGVSRLTGVVGRHWAKWIAMAGRGVDAEDARMMGLVHQVLPDEGFHEGVHSWVRELIELPAEAVGTTKIAVGLAADVDRASARDVERLANTSLMLNRSLRPPTE